MCCLHHADATGALGKQLFAYLLSSNVQASTTLPASGLRPLPTAVSRLHTATYCFQIDKPRKCQNPFTFKGASTLQAVCYVTWSLLCGIFCCFMLDQHTSKRLTALRCGCFQALAAAQRAVAAIQAPATPAYDIRYSKVRPQSVFDSVVLQFGLMSTV